MSLDIVGAYTLVPIYHYLPAPQHINFIAEYVIYVACRRIVETNVTGGKSAPNLHPYSHPTNISHLTYGPLHEKAAERIVGSYPVSDDVFRIIILPLAAVYTYSR